MEGYIEETSFVKDGRKAMIENPDPKKYWVVRDAKDGSVRRVFRPHVKEDDFSDLDKMRLQPRKFKVVAEWHKDDQTASKVLQFKF